MRARNFAIAAVMVAGSLLSASDAEAGWWGGRGVCHRSSSVCFQPTSCQPSYCQPSFQSPCQSVPSYRTVPRSVSSVDARLQNLELLSGNHEDRIQKHESRIQTLETSPAQP